MSIARIVVVLGLLILVVGALAAAQMQPLPQTVLSTPIILRLASSVRGHPISIGSDGFPELVVDAR